MAKTKTKVYDRLHWMGGSLSEWQEFDNLCNKVKECLDHRLVLGGHTIPEIAEDIGEDEQRVADALYSLCCGRHPQALIAGDAWEKWFKELHRIEGDYPQPFTNKTKFYTWVAR